MARRKRRLRCTTQVIVRLPARLAARLDGIALDKGVTKSDVLRLLLTKTRMRPTRAPAAPAAASEIAGSVVE